MTIRRKSDRKTVIYPSPERQPLNGDDMRKIRKKLNLTQAQLAQLLGTIAPHISAIENGYRNFPRSIEFALALIVDEFRRSGQLIAAETLKRNINKTA